jgi:hypothetical protein
MIMLLRIPLDHKLFIVFVLHEEFLYFEGASLSCRVVYLKLSNDWKHNVKLNV